MKKPHHIHFVGIKGVGMTPLAVIAKEAGIQVTGSDISDVFITDEVLRENDITPLVGFLADHVSADVDLVIATGAHGGQANPEVLEAKKRGIPILMKGQAVGEYMTGDILGRQFVGVSVAGSHGKTTTTAMIATIFSEAGLAPSFLVGTSSIIPLGASGRLGSGDYFIAEADEYATDPAYDKTPQFLWQHPKIAVFTNIELDHPDIYPDVEAVAEAFSRFAGQVVDDGLLVACGDDERIQDLLSSYAGRYVTYGLGEQNEYRVSRVEETPGGITFTVSHKDKQLGLFSLSVFGEHNALNGLAAIIVARESGIALQKVSEGLEAFQGAKRRLERIGTLATGALLYDDYAHHPTEIKKTLQALREHFSNKKIVCIFQPHTYSRTKKLLDDFCDSLATADAVLLAPIYASLREKDDPSISSVVIAEKLQQSGKEAISFSDISDIAHFVTEQKYSDDTILVMMGAGNIYELKTLLPQAR